MQQDEADITAVTTTPESSLALGDSYFVDEIYEEALNSYAIGLTLNSSASAAAIVQFRTRSHKAEAHIRLKQFGLALEEVERAFDVDEITGLRKGETELAYKRQGQIFIELERYKEANVAFQKAMQLNNLNNNNSISSDKYQHLIQKCEEKTGNTTTTTTEEKTGNIIENNEDEETLIVEEVDQKAPTKKKQSTSVAPKYQYYQNDKFMTIAVLEPSVKPEQLHVTFRTKHLTVIFTTSDEKKKDFTLICDKLNDKVIVDKCKVLFKEEKVLIKLRKLEVNRDWHELFYKSLNKDDDKDDVDSEEDKKIKIVSTRDETSTTTVPIENTNNKASAYASHRDWDAIDRDLAQKEKSEKPEGEDAMNSLFQQIYSNSDEDTKRAMIKSYQTSGGTVLSTNWGEVKEKNYEKEREAPNGMEWKTWEGDKIKEKNEKNAKK